MTEDQEASDNERERGNWQGTPSFGPTGGNEGPPPGGGQPPIPPPGGYGPPPPGGYGYYYPPPPQWFWHNGRWYNTPQAEDGTWLVKNDRTMAMLAHLLAIFTGFLGPLILYFVKRDDSKFAAFHALQALYFTLLVAVVQVAIYVLGFGLMFATSASSHSHSAPPAGFFGGFFAAMCFVTLIGIGELIYFIVMCIKANKGEWARYFIVGDWALNRVERRYSQYGRP